MTAPIIPADQWPDTAAFHVWDETGLGNWLWHQLGVWYTWPSEIPMPAGHDWRVPVLRPRAEPATPVADFRGWHCAHCQRGVDASEVTYHEQHEACGRVITDDRPPAPQPAPASDLLKQAADVIRELQQCISVGLPAGKLHARAADVLALIDGQANVRSSSEHSEPALIDGQTQPFNGELRPDDLAVESWPSPAGFQLGLPRGIKVTHKPTGTVVTCDTERSQHANRDRAMAMLRAKLQPTKGEGVADG